MTSSRAAMALIAGLAFTGAAHTASAQSKAEIQGMDRDHDGVVTRAEWRGQEGAFRLHDTNRDGVLSGAEVWDAKEIRARGDFNDWTARGFNDLDRNRDNRITLNEWHFNQQEFRVADQIYERTLVGLVREDLRRIAVVRDGLACEREVHCQPLRCGGVIHCWKWSTSA